MEHRGLSAIPGPIANHEFSKNEVHRTDGNSFLPQFLRNMKIDDIILIGIVILLLTDSNTSNDKLLIGVLVFIFLAGMEGNLFGLL